MYSTHTSLNIMITTLIYCRPSYTVGHSMGCGAHLEGLAEIPQQHMRKGNTISEGMCPVADMSHESSFVLVCFKSSLGH